MRWLACAEEGRFACVEEASLWGACLCGGGLPVRRKGGLPGGREACLCRGREACLCGGREACLCGGRALSAALLVTRPSPWSKSLLASAVGVCCAVLCCLGLLCCVVLSRSVVLCYLSCCIVLSRYVVLCCPLCCAVYGAVCCTVESWWIRCGP